MKMTRLRKTCELNNNKNSATNVIIAILQSAACKILHYTIARKNIKMPISRSAVSRQNLQFKVPYDTL